jgi:RNA polymerase sigma-70 factor, ECF subfamily
MLQVTGEEGSQRLSPAVATIRLPAEASDEVLMCRVGADDSEALAVMFRRYSRAVRSVAYRAVRDISEADDLVQEVFILVHRNASAFDPSKGSARGWILQIAHRRAISRRRFLSSRHFYNRIDLDDLTNELGDPQAAVGQPKNTIAETFGESDFQRAFDELSPSQRETLRLHFFDGYSLAEIATMLGQCRGNIKHYYFRGLEKLRKQLVTGKLQPSKRSSPQK